MRIGASLALIAAGAVLRFAISRTVNGVNLHTVGVILIIVGAIGGLITLVMMGTRRRTDVVRRNDGSTTVVEPRGGVNDPRY